MRNTPSDFFEPVKTIKYISSSNYKKVESYLQAFQAMSNLIDMSYYIIDYYKKSFAYVSPNPLFLSGYTRNEVLKLGFDFYPLCVPQEDIQLLFNLNVAGFDFFYGLPEERRRNGYISYDFRLRNKINNSLIMINHRVTPLLFNEDGNIWMSLCLVSLSPRIKAGDVHIVMHDERKRYNLNVKTNRFERIPYKKLTNKELKVLSLVALGDNTTTISKKLIIAESTVKNHKTNIFKKLNAKTSAEAVFHATRRGLI